MRKPSIHVVDGSGLRGSSMSADAVTVAVDATPELVRLTREGAP